ncbi:hypothetical protein D7Y56_00345 (plasmid) [Streptomyces sp. S501]|uniref:hypothetical protein n=1 Tax=Streptomyces sp. S501 TaxID=2420135 RepID=UPI00106EF751|nr:hypothetical protein [Streptomyces sp. S501]QBR04542.1 hypothetical protein D7Y56_00345 [Streptomyces sp. S501]
MTDIGVWTNKSDRTVLVANSENEKGFIVGSLSASTSHNALPWENRGFLYIDTKKAIYRYQERNNKIYGGRDGDAVSDLGPCSSDMQVTIDTQGNVSWSPR